MKRLIIETGLAALIFFAANAVYGIDAYIGRNIDGARDYAQALLAGRMNSSRDAEEIENVRLPSPIYLQIGNSNEETGSFCLESEFGRQAVRVTAPKKFLALVSDKTSLPYELKVLVRDGQDVQSAGAGIVAARCGGKDNIHLKVTMDDGKMVLAKRSVFTDTVILTVDPE